MSDNKNERQSGGIWIESIAREEVYSKISEMMIIDPTSLRRENILEYSSTDPPPSARSLFMTVLSLPIPSVPPAAISHTLRTESVISPAFIANRLKVKCTRG